MDHQECLSDELWSDNSESAMFLNESESVEVPTWTQNLPHTHVTVANVLPARDGLLWDPIRSSKVAFTKGTKVVHGPNAVIESRAGESKVVRGLSVPFYKAKPVPMTSINILKKKSFTISVRENEEDDRKRACRRTMLSISPYRSYHFAKSYQRRKPRTPNTAKRMTEEHRIKERTRHKTLNEAINELGECVPTLDVFTNGRDTKVNILQKLVAYICFLEDNIHRYGNNLGMSLDDLPSLNMIDFISALPVDDSLRSAVEIYLPFKSAIGDAYSVYSTSTSISGDNLGEGRCSSMDGQANIAFNDLTNFKEHLTHSNNGPLQVVPDFDKTPNFSQFLGDEFTVGSREVPHNMDGHLESVLNTESPTISLDAATQLVECRDRFRDDTVRELHRVAAEYEDLPIAPDNVGSIASLLNWADGKADEAEEQDLDNEVLSSIDYRPSSALAKEQEPTTPKGRGVHHLVVDSDWANSSRIGRRLVLADPTNDPKLGNLENESGFYELLTKSEYDSNFDTWDENFMDNNFMDNMDC